MRLEYSMRRTQAMLSWLKADIFIVNIFNACLAVTASPCRYPLPVTGTLPVTGADVLPVTGTLPVTGALPVTVRRPV